MRRSKSWGAPGYTFGFTARQWDRCGTASSPSLTGLGGVGGFLPAGGSDGGARGIWSTPPGLPGTLGGVASIYRIVMVPGKASLRVSRPDIWVEGRIRSQALSCWSPALLEYLGAGMCKYRIAVVFSLWSLLFHDIGSSGCYFLGDQVGWAGFVPSHSDRVCTLIALAGFKKSLYYFWRWGELGFLSCGVLA